MNIYKVKLKHDKGVFTLTINGSSEEQIKQAVMNMEKCPERAIISIKLIKSL